MPTALSKQDLMDLRRRDQPAFAPIDAFATLDGQVHFDGYCGVNGTTRTPEQALRFAAHVRQVAIEAQRRKEAPHAK